MPARFLVDFAAFQSVFNRCRQAGLLGTGSFTSLSGYAYSIDGGHSFIDRGFVPASGTFILEGDPALGFDSAGNVYYGSLLADDPSSNCSYIGISKSTSTSPSLVFGPPVAVSGPGSCSLSFEDKEFLAVDTTGGHFNGRVYVAWSEFPPDGQPGEPQALLAASTSTSPLAFGPTIALALSSGSFQHGTFPVVGPEGTVYVAWSTLTSFETAASATINLVKSTDGGSKFGHLVTVANFTSTSGDLGSGGMSLRTRSFPYLAIDNTAAGSGPRDNLYVVFQGKSGNAASSIRDSSLRARATVAQPLPARETSSLKAAASVRLRVVAHAFDRSIAGHRPSLDWSMSDRVRHDFKQRVSS